MCWIFQERNQDILYDEGSLKSKENVSKDQHQIASEFMPAHLLRAGCPRITPGMYKGKAGGTHLIKP